MAGADNATTLKNCVKIKNSEYSGNFSICKFSGTPCGRVPIFHRDGNTITSENCIAITSEKYLCTLSVTSGTEIEKELH